MKHIYLFILFLILQGCASNTGYFASKNTMQASIVNEKIIINDVVKTVKKFYSPAKITLSLFMEQEDEFSINFTNALRKEGYAVSINQGELGYIPIAYKLDMVGSLIRITVNIDKIQFSKLYSVGDSTIHSYSPITLRGL